MKWNNTDHLLIHLAFVCAMAALLLWGSSALMAIGAARAQGPSPQINKVFITDVRDGSFVVSWTTSEASGGEVAWGEATPSSHTSSDPVTGVSAHYVTVPQGTALMPETQYLFQVESGGSVDDRNGDYYAITTGPTMSISPPGDTIWGYVYQADGSTPAPYVTVYLQVIDNDGAGSAGASQWATARTDASGVWYYAIHNIRTADAGDYFSFSDGADNLHVIVRGGVAGVAEVTTSTPADYPGGAYQLGDIVLGSASAPVTPASSISAGGASDVQLSWPHQAQCADYEIWWSESPYFDRSDSGSHWLADVAPPLAGATVDYTHVGALNNAINEYYVITCFNLAGEPATGSSTVGAFTFNLTPGGS